MKTRSLAILAAALFVGLAVWAGLHFARPRVGLAGPSAWTVPAWWVDPGNASGCASDNNTGTSATCAAGGVGPLLTFGAIVARWGTLEPVLYQNTTITFLSSQTSNADPVILRPYLAGAYLIVQGVIGASQQVATGTLSGVTAKNQATNTLFSATLNGFTTAYSLNGTTLNAGISITPANLDAAVGATGFGGFAWRPGGGSITNTVNN